MAYTMKTVLTFAILTFLATVSYADESAKLITIKGLNLRSSPQQITDILGRCQSNDLIPNVFICEGSTGNTGSYVTNADGRIAIINIHCQIINGCEYSEDDLAYSLSEQLDLSNPRFEIPNRFVMDGSAGDELGVLTSPLGLTVSISEGTYYNPPLSLD